VFTFFSFIYLSKFQGASKYGTYAFFFQDRAKAAEAVELERRASDAPEILKQLYHNKFTYWGKIFLEHYGYALSPQHLFLDQEGSGIFSIWFRGQLYYIEAPLLLLGILYMFQTKKKEFWLLSSFVLIGPLPAALGAGPFTYTIRTSFVLPWLMVYVASGIYALSFYLHHRIKLLVYLLVIITYLYLIGGYITQYYFEWTKYGGKYYSQEAKDIISFIGKNRDKKIIAANVSHMLLLDYGFYNQTNPVKLQQVFKNNLSSIDNLTILPQCIQFNSQNYGALSGNVIYAIEAPCNSRLKPTSIIKTSDSKEITWRIYEIKK
jgi:uncharacterized membrane protein